MTKGSETQSCPCKWASRQYL